MPIPPGQRVIAKEKWPVMNASQPPIFSESTWKLTVEGLVENPLIYNWTQFQLLPAKSVTADMHCVTRWTIEDMEWQGVDFYHILQLAIPHKDAISVEFTSFDSIGYTTSLHLNEDGKLSIPEQRLTGEIDDTMGFIGNQKLEPTGNQIMLEDVLLATHANGKPLTPDHGYPVRVVIPRLYGWKGAKWVSKINFKKTHDLGFWEQYGYSDTADPLLEDRTNHPEAQKKKFKIYKQVRSNLRK